MCRCNILSKKSIKIPQSSDFLSLSMSRAAQKKQTSRVDYGLGEKDTKLKLNKVAIIGKTTRYDFERQMHKDLTEEEFEKKLKSRGQSYEKILSRYKMQQKALEKILSVLRKQNISYEFLSRWDLNKGLKCFDWADAILTAGGDGTFLSTASKITNRDTPVIGINTDPVRSQGHLCLPTYCADDFDQVLNHIKNNNFSWLFRTRLRVTVTGPEESFVPLSNSESSHQPEHHRPHNYMGASSDSDDSYLESRPPCFTQRQNPGNKCKSEKLSKEVARPLPILALNEIFFGELLSSVPTYYDLQADDSPMENQKSSGVCISTGTGSTAWSYNICALHSETVRHILKILPPVATTSHDFTQDELINYVSKRMKERFVFEPGRKEMLFSIRDPMQNNVYNCRTPNGFCTKLTLKSRCWDAALCIDGSTSFTFNDGASATITVHPEDQLRTIALNTSKLPS